MKFYYLIPFSILFILTCSGKSAAQSGWSTNRWYAYQGESRIETAYQREWNPYYETYTNVRYCRQLNWHQEWYAGYVYYWQWDPYYRQYRWSSQWQEGYFWYCTWSGWYGC